MAVFTQLDKLDLKGKKLIPLMTHEGSGLGVSVRDLKKFYKDAIFGEGLAVHGAEAKQSEKIVAEWAKQQVN